MNFAGLLIGISTFLIIGLFHPLVIKVEYHWGTKPWWVFLLAGIGGIAISMLVENVVISSLSGVFAFSSLWTIKELFEQQKRVAKGWFPKKDKKQNQKSSSKKNRKNYSNISNNIKCSYTVFRNNCYSCCPNQYKKI